MKPAAAPAPLTRVSDPLEVIAFCLTAPATPADADPDKLRAMLREVLKRADANLRQTPDASWSTARLKALAQGDLSSARDGFASDGELARDIFLARAFAERPDDASDLLGKRAYLEAAETPAADTELTLDRTIADEQLTPAALVTQPDRGAAIEAAFNHFRREYARHYLEHHRRYRATAAALHERLLQAGPRSRALALLNTLTELGPPVGEVTIERIDELLAAADECSSTGDLAAELAERPVCPACEVKLTESPPTAEVDDAISRLDRSIERQMERLTSAAVSRALSNSGEPAHRPLPEGRAGLAALFARRRAGR